MGNQAYKHKYETCEHNLQTFRNVDELKRFNTIKTFINKYNAFDVQKLTGAMKNMETSKKVPPDYLIRYAEDINLPRISLVINLQEMFALALALKLNYNENMMNIYKDMTKRLLNDVTEIIDKHRLYKDVYYKDQQDHNDLISVQKMLQSEVTLLKKLGDMSVQNVVHGKGKSSIVF